MIEKEPKPQRKVRAEKPVPFMVRLYKRQRKLVKDYAKYNKVSEAEIIRGAIDDLAL
jgi:hypothetical protein